FSAATFDAMLFDRAVMLTVSDTSHGEEEKTIREKILQRAGTVIAFSPHEMDAEIIERVFYPYVSPEELGKLSPGECLVMLAIDSVRSRPFFATGLPPAGRSGVSPRDLELDSRSAYTIERLKAEELFRPRKNDDKKFDAEDPGSFSDAFRSIFTKRTGAPAQ